jgi:seryl-tRNA synthetase
MREIVCIGTASEVKEFLASFQEKLAEFFKEIKLPIEWQNATDPFFNPKTNPKYLMQKLEPVKTEMIYQNHLAIGSINFHRNYFGEAFHINRNGEEAFSGCVAFGIERWIYAYLSQFGLKGAP